MEHRYSSQLTPLQVYMRQSREHTNDALQASHLRTNAMMIPGYADRLAASFKAQQEEAARRNKPPPTRGSNGRFAPKAAPEPKDEPERDLKAPQEHVQEHVARIQKHNEGVKPQSQSQAANPSTLSAAGTASQPRARPPGRESQGPAPPATPAETSAPSSTPGQMPSADQAPTPA